MAHFSPATFRILSLSLPGLCVYITWSLLSFLNILIIVFYQIWEASGHEFLQILFLPLPSFLSPILLGFSLCYVDTVSELSSLFICLNSFFLYFSQIIETQMTYIQAYQFFSDSSDLLLSSHKEFSNFSYCTFSIPEFLFFFNLFFMCTVSISLLIFSHWQDLVLMISFKFLNMVSVRVGSKFSPTLPLHSQQIPCAQYRTCWQAHKSYWM